MERGWQLVGALVAVALVVGACSLVPAADQTQPIFRAGPAGDGEDVLATATPTEPSGAVEAAPAGRMPLAAPGTVATEAPTATATPTMVPATATVKPLASLTPTTAPPTPPPPTATPAPPTPPDTPLPSATAIAAPTGTPTPLPTPTPTELPPTATPTPVVTLPPTSAPVLPLGVIEGNVILSGEPLTQPVTVVLENAAYEVNRQVETVGSAYRFVDLPATTDGYSVLFAQDRNPQYAFDDVVGWAWIGPVPVKDGDEIALEDLEIGLLGLHQLNPSPDAVLSEAEISGQAPVVFEWAAYPSATRYWLELRSGGAQTTVWRSGFVETPSVAFDGVLANGGSIQPGSYWWYVGARIDGSSMVVSGPLAAFTLSP